MQDQQSFQNAGIEGLFDLDFQRFITLNVIKILYGLGFILIALMWLFFVVASFSQGLLPGIGALVLGTIGAALYLIFYRVWLELIVVLFRIGENTSILVGQRTNEDTPSVQ